MGYNPSHYSLKGLRTPLMLNDLHWTAARAVVGTTGLLVLLMSLRTCSIRKIILCSVHCFLAPFVGLYYFVHFCNLHLYRSFSLVETILFYG